MSATKHFHADQLAGILHELDTIAAAGPGDGEDDPDKNPRWLADEAQFWAETFRQQGGATEEVAPLVSPEQSIDGPWTYEQAVAMADAGMIDSECPFCSQPWRSCRCQALGRVADLDIALEQARELGPTEQTREELIARYQGGGGHSRILARARLLAPEGGADPTDLYIALSRRVDALYAAGKCGRCDRETAIMQEMAQTVSNALDMDDAKLIAAGF